MKIKLKTKKFNFSLEAGKSYITTPSTRTSNNRIEKSTIHILGLSTLLFVLKYVVELIMSIVNIIT